MKFGLLLYNQHAKGAWIGPATLSINMKACQLCRYYRNVDFLEFLDSAVCTLTLLI
jgi:hypothetical protein